MMGTIKKAIAARKELRYLIAGVASECIEYASFLILFSSTHLLYFSNSASFIFGVISGFIFHKTWSFRGEHQFKTRQQFWGYISLAGVNFILINILIGLYVNKFGMTPALAKFFAIGTTIVWTYAITNTVIFRQSSKKEPENQEV